MFFDQLLTKIHIQIVLSSEWSQKIISRLFSRANDLKKSYPDCSVERMIAEFQCPLFLSSILVLYYCPLFLSSNATIRNYSQLFATICNYMQLFTTNICNYTQLYATIRSYTQLFKPKWSKIIPRKLVSNWLPRSTSSSMKRSKKPNLWQLKLQSAMGCCLEWLSDPPLGQQGWTAWEW